MKKLLMLFGVVAMIHTTGAFGEISYTCYVDYDCDDGSGVAGQYEFEYNTRYYIRTIPENTVCSKSGSRFSHWAVTANVSNGTTFSPVAYPGESYSVGGCDANNRLTFTAVYVSNGATTSKPYVDDQIATRQVKIPAANPSNTNIGDTVITYTNVAGGGVIGERQLFTGENTYTAGDANKLITASALNERFTNLPTTDTTKLQCANQDDGCTLWTIVDQTAYMCKPMGASATVSSECCTGVLTSAGKCGCAKKSDCGSGETCSSGNCVSGFGPIGPIFPQY